MEIMPEDEGTIKVPDIGFDNVISLDLLDPTTSCIKNKIILRAIIKLQNSKVKNEVIYVLFKLNST